MKTRFYSWMKLKTEKKPSPETDQKILAYSKDYFSKRTALKNHFNWKLSGIVALASIALVVIFINKESSQSTSVLITESPEMILNYKEIELMAAASNLSEAEWANINGTN